MIIRFLSEKKSPVNANQLLYAALLSSSKQHKLPENFRASFSPAEATCRSGRIGGAAEQHIRFLG